MKGLAPLLVGIGSVISVATATPVSAAASPAALAPNAYECVTIAPLYVFGHQLTDQYEVCVPTPGAALSGTSGGEHLA